MTTLIRKRGGQRLDATISARWLLLLPIILTAILFAGSVNLVLLGLGLLLLGFQVLLLDIRITLFDRRIEFEVVGRLARKVADQILGE